MDGSGGQSGVPLRLGLLISGGGSTMVNLAEHIARGELPAQIVSVISSRHAGGVRRAEELGLAAEVIQRTAHESTESFSADVWDVLRAAEVDLVCMGGFLSLLAIPEEYLGKVMNVHPALLPSFGGEGMWGRHVHEAVLGAGCKVSGCTVHFADEDYDRGPIIIQRSCVVEEEDTPDTLAARVIAEERIAYPEAVRLFAAGRLRIEEGRVRVMGAG